MHSPTPKRTVLVILGALLLLCVAVLLITLSTQRYVAVSMVLVKPYTNAFFAQSFESEVIQKTPTVLSVRAVPSISAIIPPSTPVATNGVIIRIEAFGPSVVEAENAANEAARNICQMASTNYEVTGQVIHEAGTARKYSFLHDALQPTIRRWFKR